MYYMAIHNKDSVRFTEKTPLVTIDTGKNMEPTEILVNSGKSVINRLYRQNKIKTYDDSEFIPTLKMIIYGIADEAVKLIIDDKQIESIMTILKDHAKDLYITLWLSNGEEGDDIEVETENAIYYFDYIYEHEEHPR